MTTEQDIERFVLRFAKMREIAAQTVREQPDDMRALDAAAQAYLLSGDYVSACQVRLQARRVDPNSAYNLYHLGVVQEYLGQFDEARQSYESAVRINPDHAGARYASVRLVKQSAAHNQIDDLKRRLEAPDAEGWRSLFLGHALAKTYEDLGDLETSFEWLRRGKQRRNVVRPYDGKYERQVTDACLSASERIAEGNPGSLSDEPIFVCGLPRSGTTLVDRILSSHGQVTSVGEIENFIALTTLSAAALGDQAPGTMAGLRDAHLLDLRRLGERYVVSTRPNTGATAKFVDKAPSNYLWTGLIHRALPNARIVCVTRAPLDLCLGNYRQIFPIDDRFYDYANDLSAIADKVTQFTRVSTHWRDRLPGDRFKLLSYESLVQNQVEQTRALLEFCGLPWDDNCLRFHENTTAVGTPSAAQVREPINANAVERWRRYGSLLDPAAAVLAKNGLI
ncbi:MAG: sulfotransferase [Proteobacteria bacterium]|nr:sulfotransferase [Pseudomonadota bacterium]